MDLSENPSVLALIQAAKAEDLGPADVTTQLLANPEQPSRFRLLIKQAGVLAGAKIVPPILQAYDPKIDATFLDACADGAAFDKPPIEVAFLTGPLGSILAAERVVLNFLQHLSGIATLTRAYVDAVKETQAIILDTRKTTPGWRELEKYAVRCGGGRNHRAGLFDAVLIKDNHLAGVPTQRLASHVFDMLNGLDRPEDKPSLVHVEAENIEQAEQLFKVVGIDVVLLDNFDTDRLAQAVALRDRLGLKGKVALEATGGVTLETVGLIARTGVERISVGALTHSAQALDLSLERVCP